MNKSSHRRCSIKEGVLKNFWKFTGKHLCQSLIFNKVTGFRSATSFKKETLAEVLSCEFCENFKNNFFYRTTPVDASDSAIKVQRKHVFMY